jgi:general secretion pathway protein D
MRKFLLSLCGAFFIGSLSFAVDRDGYTERFVAKDVEISKVAQMLADLSGKSLVITPRVRGKVTFYINEKISYDQLWNIFSEVLNQYGYVLRYNKKANVVEIVPSGQVHNLPFTPEGNYTGEYTLGVFSLKYIAAKEAEKLLKPLLSIKGRIFPLGVHFLGVWDYRGNLDLIASILPKIDNPSQTSVARIYRLKYIDYRTFESVVRSMAVSWQRETGNQVYLSSIPQTNAVLVIAPEGFQKKLTDLKKKLDSLSPSEIPNFYVIKLKFTSVEEIEKSLNKLLSEARSGNGFRFPNGVKISFDKSANAVLVYATPKEYETLKRFISLLDRRRKQVLITATVVETSAKNVFDQGIHWQLLGKSGGTAFGGMSRESAYQAFAQGNFVLGTFSTSGVNVNIGGSNIFFPDLLFLYTLLQQGTGFHIISNPKILTLDNKKATIKVGQEAPFPTGIKYDTNGNPIITYDYKYVGLELDVTPRISTKSLRLIINLKLQEITGYLNNNVGGINYSVPITSTRELNSDVVVQNGQTVIIGGLIGTKTLKSMTGVPVLSDIPLIGNLFKYKHKEKEKTNLFIFITPYVISSPEQLEKIMREHKKLAMEILKMQKGKKVNDKDFQRWVESINAVKSAPVR